MRLHQSPELLEQRQTWLDDLHQLSRSKRVQRFAYADKLSKDKEKRGEALQTWLSLWRDVLLCASASAVPLVNLDRAEEIEELARQCGPQQAYAAVDSLLQALDQLERNVHPQLCIEVLMLDLPYL